MHCSGGVLRSVVRLASSAQRTAVCKVAGKHRGQSHSCTDAPGGSEDFPFTGRKKSKIADRTIITAAIRKSGKDGSGDEA